jgi:hypothetical protein
MRLVAEMGAGLKKAAHGNVRKRHSFTLRLCLRGTMGWGASHRSATLNQEARKSACGMEGPHIPALGIWQAGCHRGPGESHTEFCCA